MSAKAELHRLVDELPEAQIAPAKRLLECLRDSRGDPVLWSLLRAPEDDEPLTPEDIAAAEEAKAASRRGDVVSADVAKRELLD